MLENEAAVVVLRVGAQGQRSFRPVEAAIRFPFKRSLPVTDPIDVGYEGRSRHVAEVAGCVGIQVEPATEQGHRPVRVNVERFHLHGAAVRDPRMSNMVTRPAVYPFARSASVSGARSTRSGEILGAIWVKSVGIARVRRMCEVVDRQPRTIRAKGHQHCTNGHRRGNG